MQKIVKGVKLCSKEPSAVLVISQALVRRRAGLSAVQEAAKLWSPQADSGLEELG